MSPRDSAAAAMTAPEDRIFRRPGDDNPNAVELWKLIHAEALRLLKDQYDELSAIRTRTVQYLSLIGTATAFLVGTALRGGSRDPGFYVLAGLATLVFVGTLLCGMQVLTGFMRAVPSSGASSRAGSAPPAKKWHVPKLNFHTSAAGLAAVVDSPIQVGAGKGKYYGHAAMLKKLALDAEKYHDGNEHFVKVVKRSYQLCIGLGFVQLMLWGAVAWRYGGPPI